MEEKYLEPAMEMQQQRPLSPDVYSAIVQEQKMANVIEQINPERVLIEIDHRLRGEIKNPDSGNWEKLTEEVISKKCRSNILSLLNSIFTQNTTLSNLDKKAINSIMENIIEHLRDDMEENAEEYNLSGKYAEMTRVCDIVCYLVFTLLTRAQNGMESRKLFHSLQIGEKLNYGPEKQEKFFDKLKVW